MMVGIEIDPHLGAIRNRVRAPERNEKRRAAKGKFKKGRSALKWPSSIQGYGISFAE